MREWISHEESISILSKLSLLPFKLLFKTLYSWTGSGGRVTSNAYKL
jgi:hypothetical protein